MACVQIGIVDVYTNNGTRYVYPGKSWTHKVSFGDNHIVNSDTVIYLSYAGSSASFGSEFSGPNRVTIKSGERYANFEIVVADVPTSQGKIIVTSGRSGNYTACSCFYSTILCGVVAPPREPGKDCCAYYSDTYEKWRDFYPTCMGRNLAPMYPGVTLSDGSQSTYDWY